MASSPFQGGEAFFLSVGVVCATALDKRLDTLDKMGDSCWIRWTTTDYQIFIFP